MRPLLHAGYAECLQTVIPHPGVSFAYTAEHRITQLSKTQDRIRVARCFRNITSEQFEQFRTALPRLRKVGYSVKVKVVAHPRVQDLDLAKVLQALSDPLRLELVRLLAAEKDISCSALCLGRPKSSMSHHFKTMIEAGLLHVNVEGNTHYNNLRLDDLENRFPGLLPSVLGVRQTTRSERVKPRNNPKKNP